jgi:hypothetical protein
MPAFAGDTDKFFPSNTQAVINVNLKQLLDSPLVKKDLPKIQEQIKANAEAQKHLSALGFDPLKDLESVSIGMAGVEDQDQVVMVLRGKFDLAKIKAHAAEAAKAKKDQFKIHEVDNHTIYEATVVPQQPKPMFFAVLDANTIVGAMKQDDASAAFLINAGKKKNEANKDLQSLMSKANPKQSFSLMMLGGALGNGVPFGDKIEHINGGVTLGEEIKTEFLILTKDNDSATALAEMIQQGLEQAKGAVMFLSGQTKELAPLADIVDVLKVNATDKTVSIKGDVTKEAVEKLQKK